MAPADESRGTLWIVATPIGTLGDLAPRAREVLRDVDVVLAEDTRRARTLLSHFELPTRGRLQSLHEHNEAHKVDSILAALEEGRSVALISDAGTPVISDPGFLVVRAARSAGVAVNSVPGPSSFTAALAASGQPPLPATLCGFLPPRSGARRRRISELAGCGWTLVVLLSPHRLGRELADLAQGLGGAREATLLAEISKKFERGTVATLGELASCAEVERPRGEYILVIAPPPDSQSPDGTVDPASIRRAYERAVARGVERRDALKETAKLLGVPRRVVFDVLAADDEAGDIAPEA